MLSSRELTQMRSDLETLLPDTCDILELSQESDGAGGMVDTWGTLTESVSCRVDYKSGREAVSGGAVMPFQETIVYIPYDVTVATENRLQVGENVYSIQAINNDTSWKAITRLSVELIS